MPPPSVKILIVDDEPALLKMMGIYLTRVGYAVTAFPSSDRAWAEMSEGADFAVAVLDATLRGLRTQDLALRLLDGNAAIRVVVASGYPVDMTALERAAPGRVSFLAKPFTAQTLTQTVGRLLGS